MGSVATIHFLRIGYAEPLSQIHEWDMLDTQRMCFPLDIIPAFIHSHMSYPKLPASARIG